LFIFFFWSTIAATPCGRPADIFNRLPPPPGFFFFSLLYYWRQRADFLEHRAKGRASIRPTTVFIFRSDLLLFLPVRQGGVDETKLSNVRYPHHLYSHPHFISIPSKSPAEENLYSYPLIHDDFHHIRFGYRIFATLENIRIEFSKDYFIYITYRRHFCSYNRERYT